MGKRRRRRVFRRVARFLLLATLAFGALAGVAATGATGHPTTGFLIIPAMMIGAVVGVPLGFLALVVAVGAVALPLLILAAIFGGPLYLLYWIAGGAGARSRRQPDEDDEVLPADVLLRRRYVAGEITYEQFQSGMVGFLKGRYARGEIDLAGYEVELERLLAPSRYLDVKRDRALSGAPRAG